MATVIVECKSSEEILREPLATCPITRQASTNAHACTMRLIIALLTIKT